MEPTNEKIKGSVNSAVGKAKQTAGRLTNDEDLETQGIIQKNKGKGQKVLGNIKEKLQEGAQVLGNKMDKARRKDQETQDDKS